MTSRLPATLKKRLQANLENLTAREAGRLLAVYTKEAIKKGKIVNDYAPAKELWAAFDDRVARSRGKPEGAEAVDAFNGLVFLGNILDAINFGDFVGLGIAFSSDSYQVMSRLGLLLREDATAVLIQTIKRSIFDEMPKPLPKDDYIRLMQWAETDALYPLREAASFAAETAVEDGELPEDSEEAEAERIFDALVAALEVGELVGGDAVYHTELSEPVLIEDGKLPAWAALRLTWKPNIFAQNYRTYDHATFADWSPSTIDQVVTPAGELVEGANLRRLAVAFYKDCRRRPWGKGLVAKPDVDDLVKLLTQSANSLLHINPFDFGRVDWETFRKNEADWDGYRHLDEDEKVFESEPAGTVASLAAAVEKMGRESNFSYNWLEDQFYPSSSPEGRRRELAQLVAMTKTLDTTRQPFTYGYHHADEGELSLSELLGVNFLTPLEKTVADLREQNSYAVSIRQALKVVSDRYFGGLPVLYADSDKPLLKGEEYLKLANEALKSWVDRLSRWPWQIDTTSLEVDDPEIDDELVDKIVDLILAEPKRRCSAKDPDALLGKE